MRRIALFAHFDAQNEVKRFVYYHLECLRKVCQSVAFVSNSPVDATHAAKLERLCDSVLLRENTGYDFSMWQHGIESITLNDWDELVLTNSSVFGPVFPLESALSRMQAADCDFWGMTENTQFARHVQSYFLVFRRRLLESNAFSSFWRGVLPYHDKYQTIRSYEIGLSAYFSEQGFRDATFAPSYLLQRRWPRKELYDLPLSRPLELLKARMPYVKVGLLRDNPRGVNLKPIHRAINASGYDRSMIEFDRKQGTFYVDET